MKTPPRKPVASFRTLFYFVSVIIIGILLAIIWKTHSDNADSGFTIYQRPDTRNIHAALEDAPRIPARRGLETNPGNHIPDSGFDAYYFRADAPASRLVATENTRHIAINYSHDQFRDIPSPQFAAYWVGWLDISQKGEYEFALERSRSDVRILLDGYCIYSDTPKVSDKARCRRQYAFVRRGSATPYEAFGGLLYQGKEGKSAGYVTLEPGRYLLEVEMQNHWHNTRLALTVNLLQK